MAEEDKEKARKEKIEKLADVPEEEEEVVEESGLKALLIPVLTSAVTAAAVGGLMWYFLAGKKEAPAPAPTAPTATVGTETPALPTEEELAVGGGAPVKHTGFYHQYDSFVVSIFDREKVHYLRIKIALELATQSVADEITIKDPQIKDSMIFVLGDFTVRELLDNQAKLLVKEVLIKTLNKILGKDKVIDVYFTEFVVQ